MVLGVIGEYLSSQNRQMESTFPLFVHHTSSSRWVCWHLGWNNNYRMWRRLRLVILAAALAALDDDGGRCCSGNLVVISLCALTKSCTFICISRTFSTANCVPLILQLVLPKMSCRDWRKERRICLTLSLNSSHDVVVPQLLLVLLAFDDVDRLLLVLFGWWWGKSLVIVDFLDFGILVAGGKWWMMVICTVDGDDDDEDSVSSVVLLWKHLLLRGLRGGLILLFSLPEDDGDDAFQRRSSIVVVVVIENVVGMWDGSSFGRFCGVLKQLRFGDNTVRCGPLWHKRGDL